jgi:nucleoside-diphosphate-sugar epimerase
VDENTTCKPDNIYGVTKLAGEKAVLDQSDEIPIVIIRIPEVYGPGDQRLVKLFKAVNSGAFFRIGNGLNVHHLIYIDDLVAGLLLAAQHPAAVGKLFLLAGKEAVTTDEMVDTIAAQLQVKTPRFRAPLLPFSVAATLMETILRPIGIQPPLHRRRLDFFRKSFKLSSKRAQDTIGFDPQISFVEGARRTTEYYRQMGYV